MANNYKDKSWWHIRNNFNTQHSALIIDESAPGKSGKYSFMDITTHPAKGESYIKLKHPINKKDTSSYVRKYVGNQKKKLFSKWLMKYEIDDEDMFNIENYLKSRKK